MGDEEWGDFGGDSANFAPDFDVAWSDGIEAPPVENSQLEDGSAGASNPPAGATALQTSLDATTVAKLQSELLELFPQEERPSAPPVTAPPDFDVLGPIEIPESREAEFVWLKSMCQLLLYAQIGVAVPRYEIEERRESLISDAQHRFASPIRRRMQDQPPPPDDDESEDENTDGLTFKRRNSSSNVMGKATTAVFDGLVAGVTATSMAVNKTVNKTADAVKDVGRGIGAAGSAVGSVVSKPVRVMARAVQGARACSTSSPEPMDNGPKMFETTIAGLAPEEMEKLGIVDKSSLSPEELAGVTEITGTVSGDKYVLVSEEARLLAEKMERMEAALKEEETELERQARIIEIERLENEKYPELVNEKAEATMGNDGFSKEMEASGLRHVSSTGSERRIRHGDLPDELDLFSWTGDGPPPSENGISAPAATPSSAEAEGSVTQHDVESEATAPQSDLESASEALQSL